MKIGIALLVGIVVLIGGFFLFQKPSAPVENIDDAEMPLGTASVNSEPVVTIHYTNGGYQPAMVTIKQGQAVRWINDSTDETWPASAVPPTHGIYPEKNASDCLGSSFDSCRGLTSGETWDFTFNAKGTWRFHDHLHPSKTGSVIVE